MLWNFACLPMVINQFYTKQDGRWVVDTKKPFFEEHFKKFQPVLSGGQGHFVQACVFTYVLHIFCLNKQMSVSILVYISSVSGNKCLTQYRTSNILICNPHEKWHLSC